MTEQGPPTDEELVRQLEEELKKLKVSDLLVQTLYTVSSLAYRRLSAEERDLDEARLAIESLRALIPVLESELGQEAMRDFKQVTANLQLAYADAAGESTDESAKPPEP
jgi:predicted nucleic acid-binding protein